MENRNAKAFIKTLISVMCCCAPGLATGASLGDYTFTGGDTEVPTNTANVTFSPFTRVNVTTVAANGLFRSSGWSLAAAPDTTEYVQFTITPDAGFTVSLEGITFDIERSIDKRTPSEKQGPINVRASVFQGVSLSLMGSTNFTATGSILSVYFDFSDFTTLDGEPVTVRFYAWAAGHKDGWLEFDNVNVEGSVSAIPEPSPFTMMSLGLFLFLVNGVVRHNRKA